MLLTINYWQAGKNSRMRTKLQGRLMQARLIEINQVFAKKKVGYFSNRVVPQFLIFSVFVIASEQMFGLTF